VLLALTGCGAAHPSGRIVYSSAFSTPNVGRLYVLDAAGRGLHPVTPGLVRRAESDADWSPDGARLVYSRSFACASVGACDAIWIVNADGTGERRLTPDDVRVGDLAPTWSPDGRTIAFERYVNSSGTSDIYLMDARGAHVRRLTRLGDAEQPAWAPDGGRIAFAHRGDVVVLDVRRGTTTRVTHTRLDESYPDFSPDGKRLVYELNDPSPAGLNVEEYDAYVSDADGSHPRRLSQPGDTDGHPVWSPDGRFIAYASDGGTVLGDSVSLVIVRADDGRVVKRFPLPALTEYGIDWGVG
jgi:TolB protein